MANYMHNELRVVEGDPKEVFDAIRTERSVIDFQQLIPMPDDIKNSDETVQWHSLKLPAWEAWAIDNWGTCKNACDARYLRTDVIGFDTPWCEPEPVFEALAKRFPNHKMVVISDYLDWGVEEYEVYRIQDGSLISEGLHKYEYVGEDGDSDKTA